MRAHGLDHEAVARFAADNPFLSLRAIGKHFGCSHQSVVYALGAPGIAARRRRRMLSSTKLGARVAIAESFARGALDAWLAPPHEPRSCGLYAE